MQEILLKCLIHDAWYDGGKCPRCEEHEQGKIGIGKNEVSENNKVIHRMNPKKRIGTQQFPEIIDYLQEIYFLIRASPPLEKYWSIHVENLTGDENYKRLYNLILCEIIKLVRKGMKLPDSSTIIASDDSYLFAEYSRDQLDIFYNKVISDLTNNQRVLNLILELTDSQRTRIIETFDLYLNS